jgi:chromosome segregation ATPase
MFKNILLLGAPFVLCNLMAPEGAEGGGGDPAPAPDPVPPTEPPQPEGATLEAKLTNAVGIIKNLFGRIGQLTSQLATANSQRTKLEGQFNAATGDLKTEKDAHTATKSLLGTANTQVTGLTTERDNANQNVERLEKLCSLRGIDHTKAVVTAPENQAASQTGQAKWDKYNELKTQESQSKQKPGTAMAYWKENKADIEKFAASQR